MVLFMRNDKSPGLISRRKPLRVKVHRSFYRVAKKAVGLPQSICASIARCAAVNRAFFISERLIEAGGAVVNDLVGSEKVVAAIGDDNNRRGDKRHVRGRSISRRSVVQPGYI